jgi:hypothetical protein
MGHQNGILLEIFSGNAAGNMRQSAIIARQLLQLYIVVMYCFDGSQADPATV